jgi:hypothetical protein
MEHFSKIEITIHLLDTKNPKEIIDVVGMKIPTILKCLVLD